MTQSKAKEKTIAVADVLELLSRVRKGEWNAGTSDFNDSEDFKSVVKAVIDLAEALKAKCQDQVRIEQENAQVVDLLGIGIWKWDLLTNALEWDENMYRLYGAERHDFNGAYEAWESSLSSETKAKAVEEINAAVRGEKDFDTTFQVVHKSGKIQEIRTRAFVIRDETGMPLKMHGINVDRTREAALERDIERERAKSMLNAKLASLGEMSAGIAHEINNPLAIIAGTVRALPRFVTDPGQFQSRMEQIVSASERIAKIVKSLRKFSRSDAKSQHTLHELRGIVNEALVLTEAKSRRHGTQVSFECRSSSRVLCDEIEMEQVMVNLINNAIDAVKACPEKWVRIALYDEDSLVVLRVQDAGAGISPEVKQKLFQPFFTTKPTGQGTGLGLSIVKGIIEDHHATIDVLAHDPHTCFEIRFPRVGS